MSIYVKTSTGVDKLIEGCRMRRGQSLPTGDYVTSGDNSAYYTIYSGYVQSNLSSSTATKIPYPAEWSTHTFVYIDAQNSYITNTTVTYPISFHDGTNRITAYVDKRTNTIVLNHNSGWGSYAAYVAVRMCD